MSRNTLQRGVTDPTPPVAAAAVNPRLIGIFALLGGELAIGLGLFTIPEVSTQPGWVAAGVAAANNFVRVGIAFTATLILILASRRESLAYDLNVERNDPWWPWLLGHAAAVVLFLFASWPFLAPEGPAELSAAWLIGWLAAGSVALGSLLLAAAPASAWLRAARREWVGLLVASGAGVLAWQAGRVAQRIW